jgi:hypothetical protein
MNDSITRDLLVAQPARNLGHGRMLTFARHDEGPNFRSTVYTRLSWIMLLDLNLDYRNEQFLREAFAKFGKMRGWIRDDPETARTLVRCAYESIADIPRSLVIREPQRYGGTVVSWTVPVYVLSSEQADLLPGDESPPPANGNPHPLHFVGPIPPAGNWVPPAENAWNVWNEEDAAENVPDPAWEQPQANVFQQQQQPAQIQSTISFQLSDFSNSSVQFVPGPGPVQEVLVQQQYLQAQEVVLVEDIDENDEDFVMPHQHNVAVVPEQLDFNPLAIVPYVPPFQPFAALLVHDSPAPVVMVDAAKEKSTMRRLLFDEGEQNVPFSDMAVPAVSAPKKKTISRETPETEASVRRSTRQSVKRDGFKLEPMRDKVTPPRKKPKSVKPRIPKPADKSSASPHTPVSTLRKVGIQLEIPEEEMTVEKLMAAPVEGKGKMVINE